MAFLGLEKPIEYSGVLVFDPTMAKMVLDAQDKYFNVLYADYQQGLQDMKEFKKEYGDFVTPILADLEWYNKNVTGKVRNFINDAYARGIDLTRSAEGRAAIAQMINSIDVGSVAKLRSSAENAREFLKERSRLEAQGLYNPLLAKYEGFDPNTYSTLDQLDAEGNVIAGRGVWDKMSPTRITDMATFGNPYFEGMKPNVHRESKNGIEYSVESITPEDLKRIANDHFNELVSTPQGQLMYKYYADTLGEDKARDAFNAAVAAGLSRRIYTKDDYDDNYYKAENLKLQRSSNRLAWEKFYWDKDKELQELDIKKTNAGGGSNKEGRNYLQEQFDRGMLFMVTGNVGKAELTPWQILYYAKEIANSTFNKTKGLRYGKEADYEDNKKAYLNSTVKQGVLSAQALTNGLGRVKDNSRSNTVFLDSGDINRLVDDNELVTTTFGARRNGQRRYITNKSKLNEIGSDNLKMQFTDDTYTAPMTYSNGTGRMEQYQKVKVYRSYGQDSKNKRDELVGEYWFRVQQGRIMSSTLSSDNKRIYSTFDSSVGDDLAGYMQPIYQSMEKSLGSTSSSFTNSQTRLD